MQTYTISHTGLISVDRSLVGYNGAPASDYGFIIGDMPSDERPREKLLAKGPEALTTRELAVLLLITGTTKERVVEMADRLVRDYGERNIFAERDAEKLAAELDIPLVKACQIVAAGELGRRMFDKGASRFVVIKNAKDIYEYLRDMRDLPKEQMRALYLNSHGRIIHDEVVSIGTVNANFVHPRDIFSPAIALSAVAVVIAHNHPSGELVPSAEDVTITGQLVQAGKILGIRLLDHVIIAKDSFVSIPVKYE